MKKLVFFLLIALNIMASGDLIKDFGLLSWKSSKALVSIYYEDLVEDPVFSNGSDIDVLSSYEHRDDISRLSFYFYKNQLFKVEVLYSSEYADLNYLNQRVDAMTQQYGIYSLREKNEKLGFFRKSSRILAWARGYTLISLQGIDLYDENNVLIDSELLEVHEYYPISIQLKKSH